MTLSSAVASSTLPVSVTGADVNAVVADVVVVPVDARLQADRRLARAVLAACDASVSDSLQRLAAVVPTGMAPAAVVLLPAVGHPHLTAIALVVMFDNRCDGAAHVLEPDDARLETAALAVATTLAGQAFTHALVTPLGGRVLDSGEAGATVTRILQATAPALRLTFVEVDDVARANIGAAIESIDVDVIRV